MTENETPSFGINSSVQDIIATIDCAALLYDTARVVDPVNKKVVLFENGSRTVQQGSCFSYWTANSMCRNCISMRAWQSGKAMMKLEYNRNTINLVTAVPVAIAGERFVVEMIKDITETMFFSGQAAGDGDVLKKIVDSFGDVAVRDSLTGVYNRRFINEQLPEEIRLCREQGRRMTLVMMDIDNFKMINDTWGHRMGDLVLVEFASLIGGCLRKNEDWLARYGGDEFLAMLWDTSSDDARLIAERMRALAEATPVVSETAKLNITASIGVYTLGDGDEDYTDVMQKVDNMLYSAKQSGRNRIMA